MKTSALLKSATIGLALALIQSGPVQAAEVKVIVGVAMRPTWEELGPRFEGATGHKLTTWYGFAAPYGSGWNGVKLSMC